MVTVEVDGAYLPVFRSHIDVIIKVSMASVKIKMSFINTSNTEISGAYPSRPFKIRYLIVIVGYLSNLLTLRNINYTILIFLILMKVYLLRPQSLYISLPLPVVIYISTENASHPLLSI